MEAETLIITFVIFLTGAVLVAYAAQEIGHAQKQALLRLLRRGVISEEIHSEFVANIDELLKSPSTMDWIWQRNCERDWSNWPAKNRQKMPVQTTSRRRVSERVESSWINR